MTPEQLRHEADTAHDPVGMSHSMMVAADEIERLEKSVAEWASAYDNLAYAVLSFILLLILAIIVIKFNLSWLWVFIGFISGLLVTAIVLLIIK